MLFLKLEQLHYGFLHLTHLFSQNCKNKRTDVSSIKGKHPFHVVRDKENYLDQCDVTILASSTVLFYSQ